MAEHKVGEVVRVRKRKCELVTWSENRAVVRAVDPKEHSRVGFMNVEWREVHQWRNG